MAGNTTTIELKVNGIAQIKKELRELKGELASATDPQQMAELAAKAGELSDQLKDANERVAVFASGSPFEKTNNALGLMGSQLMSLDFEGAAESSKLFASAAKGINGDVIAKSLKGLGTVVVQVGKAFMSVGLSLLTNPIFLIAAAIAAIVAIIVLLMNKLGILKPILNAIGKVFGWIMAIIDGVVAAFKMLTDWLGLTAHAAEESAARQIKANQAVANSAKKLQEQTVKDYDQKIELAKIDGEDTKRLEAEKRAAIIETSKIRYQALKAQLEQNKISKTLTTEEIKGIMDGMKEAREMIAQAKFDNVKARHQDVADAKKANEEKMKADREAAKKAAELRAEAEKKRKEEAAKRLEEEKREFEERKAMMIAQADELETLLRQREENKAQREKEAEENRLATLQAAADQLAAQNKANIQKRLDEEKAYKEARLNLGADLVKGLQGLEQLLTQAGIKTAGLQKTIALVQIATDTAKAISSVIAGATAAAAAGGPAAPFLLAGYIASGIGTVLSAVASAYAALKKAPPIGGSVSGGALSAPTTTSTQAATPNVSLFGQNNNANNLTSTQSMETNQGGEMVVKAVVVESDITNAQNKANMFKSRGEL